MAKFIPKCRPLVAKFPTNAFWRQLLTKFASYKVPPVMVSTGSVAPLAMFVFCSPGWRQLQTGRSEETTVSGVSEPVEQELKEN